jgi:hypothetical protein
MRDPNTFKHALVGILLLASLPLQAADVNGDGLETILIPLAFMPHAPDVPGAFGTAWSGEVWLHNGSDRLIDLYNCNSFCPEQFVPGRMGLITHPLGERPDLGYLFYVGSTLAPRVTFANRMYERTLRGQPRGVDLPVVREGAFFNNERVFLGVPVDAGVRAAIRVYDPWVHHFGSTFYPEPPSPRLEGVRVELRREGSEATTLGTAVLRPIVQLKQSPIDYTRPAFDGIYDLGAMFPAIRDVVGRVHVRVTPIPAGAEYYAMVSVTDNSSQTVSIITAQ